METTQEVAILMVPFPCQSHLNSLLNLSILISSYGLPVHFVGSSAHNRQVQLRATTQNPHSLAKIHFHHFPTPTLTMPSIDPNKLEDIPKLPVEIVPALIAYNNFRHPIALFVQELSKKTRKVVIIFDRFIAEAVEEAISLPNVEYYAFNCPSAFHLFYIHWEAKGKPFSVEDRIVNHLPSVKNLFSEVFVKFLVSKPGRVQDRAGDIYNTSRLIEGKYIDLLARVENGNEKKQWALGNYLQGKISATKDTNHKCLEWLDRQAPRSVIYVSFGTSTCLSGDQVWELATGLEQSEQKFIWVVRGADKSDMFCGDDERIELPEGFEERVEGRGMVVRDWAPQVAILGHGSTGGFMSHCGWNSCLESLTMGVPIAAWPMHTDQPINAALLTGILKVGLNVKEWGQRDEVKASVIKKVVERLMASEEGQVIRKRAQELSIAMNESIEEGGECCKELDDFIAHILA